MQKETKLTQEVQELKHLIAVQGERIKYLEGKLKFLRDDRNKATRNRAKVLAINKDKES